MATTKETLLQYFQNLDIATLERLKKYSSLLIIPDEDLLLNVTMSQLVDKAHSLADSLFPEWTDRSKADFGEFLIELFALFSEKDFWYINAFANEGILRKMRSYSNAFSQSSTLGYAVTTCKGAAASFNVTFEAGESVIYGRGDLIVSSGGYNYSNDEEFELEQSLISTVVPLKLHEGTQGAEDVTYNGFSIFLRRPNIDVESINVVIDGITYSRVKNFGESSVDSTHYMILPEEDGSCSIYFGSDGFGVQPQIGKLIRVEYRLCKGTLGNISNSVASINDSLSSRKAISAIMVGSASGGTYAESLTSIKEKAPLSFSFKRAIVNEDIAQFVLNSFDFVHSSKVIVIGKDVVYRVIPSSGSNELTGSELLTLSSEFTPYLMAGYTGVYSPNSYRDLLVMANESASEIILDVVVSAGYNLEGVKESIRQILTDLTSPLIKASYGGSFKKIDVDLYIRSRVSGVQSVAFKIKVGDDEQIMPDVVLDETEIFSAINQEVVTVRTNVI